MIDIRNITYDGRRRNHQNGLTFYFTRRARVLSFLVDVVGDRKRKIKVTMHPDINHGRAHVHIDEHGASFAVDNGALLAGECDIKTRRLIEDWIIRHRKDLLQLWDIVKRGERYEPVVYRIKRNKTYREMDFGGEDPQHKTVVDNVVIWHNEDILIERNNDGRSLVIGTGDLFVAFPSDYMEDDIVIESLYGRVIVRRQ